MQRISVLSQISCRNARIECDMISRKPLLSDNVSQNLACFNIIWLCYDYVRNGKQQFSITSNINRSMPVVLRDVFHSFHNLNGKAVPSLRWRRRTIRSDVSTSGKSLLFGTNCPQVALRSFYSNFFFGQFILNRKTVPNSIHLRNLMSKKITKSIKYYFSRKRKFKQKKK